MASSSLSTRKKSSSPPIVAKQQQATSSFAISTITNHSQDKLEEFIFLFVSFILDRAKLNQCNEQINNLLQQQQQCHIASNLREKIKKCILDHYLNLEESNANAYLLDELVTTSTNKDLQYLAKKQSTFLFLNQQFNQTHSESQATLRSTLSSNSSKTLFEEELVRTKLVLDLYWLPECCHSHLIQSTGDTYLDEFSISKSNHLLERWVFVLQTNKKNELSELNSKSRLTLNELFQAIKPYLHYSQISFWLNQSKGQQTTNIAYSVNCSSEFHLDQSNKTITNSSNSSSITASLDTSKLAVRKLNEFDYKSFPCVVINHENRNDLTRCTTTNNTNTTSTTTASTCLNQFIQSNTKFDTLVRIDLYSSRNQFEFTYLNNCPQHHSLTTKRITINTMDSNELLKSSDDSITTTTTSSTSNNTSHSELSQDIPQPLVLTSSDMNQKQLNDNNESDLDKLLNNKLKLFEKCEPDNTNSTNDNQILQDNNNNNNFMFNLNKFKLKATNCCSLKPVNATNTETDNKDDDSDKNKFINDSTNIVNNNYGLLFKQEPVKLTSATTTTSDDINEIKLNPTIPRPILSNNHNKLIRINRSCNLPLSSSPAPIRKSGSSLFDFDNTLKNPRSIKNALSLNILNNKNGEEVEEKLEDDQANSTPNTSYMNTLCPSSLLTSRRLMSLNPNHLLGNFEESLLNGRMNPVGVVDGFYAVIGASGSFFPEHATLPVNAAFYQVNDDIAASPYLGIINLASLGKRGYKVPNKGTIQVTLFNPNNTVVKMFIVMYDLSDMPPGHRTFLRQRTMYVPLKNNEEQEGSGDNEEDIRLKSYLRYLIHLRFATSKSGKIYLHTNIKLIFARDKCEIDPSLARYEYKTITEAPQKPKYSPKK